MVIKLVVWKCYYISLDHKLTFSQYISSKHALMLIRYWSVHCVVCCWIYVAFSRADDSVFSCVIIVVKNMVVMSLGLLDTDCCFCIIGQKAIHLCYYASLGKSLRVFCRLSLLSSPLLDVSVDLLAVDDVKSVTNCNFV